MTVLKKLESLAVEFSDDVKIEETLAQRAVIKRLLCAFLLGTGLCSFAGYIKCPEGLYLKKNTVYPMEKSGATLFYSEFKKGNPDWKSFANYQNSLKFCFETMDGVPVLVVRNKDNKDNNTAWRIVSRTIPLKSPVKRALFEICCKATDALMLGQYGYKQWKSKIVWYGKKSRVLKETPLKFTGNPTSFTISQQAVEVPAGAEAFVLHLGADGPDIIYETYEAFRFVRISDISAGSDFSGKGTFISAPFVRTSGKVSFIGNFPEGSSASLQLSFAPDADGIPGKWSIFCGPDGNAGSFYHAGDMVANVPADAAWFRYKVTFTNGKMPGMLQGVTVGEFKDGNWIAPCDVQAPFVVNQTEVSGNPRKDIRIRIIDESPVDWKNISVMLDGKDITAKMKRDGDLLVYTPSAPFSDGLHKIVVKAADIEGNQSIAKRVFSLAKMPKKNVVTLRDDGITLIDGVPFFPIGITACNKKPWNRNSYDIACRDIKAAGFNMTHTYRCERGDTFYKEFMPAVKKHGLKLFISGPKGANSKDIPAFLETVKREMDNPAIISWYVADDTSSYNTSEQIAELTDYLRAVDPSRITSQADGTIGFRGFANMTNVFMPEIYPVRSKDKNVEPCVAQVITSMEYTQSVIRNEGNPNTAVWAMIQYFKGWGRQRFPTPEELRAMSFAAIITGAQGIVWYTYAPGNHLKNFGAASTPENWKVMSDVAQEINSLSPVLCERREPVQPVVKILSGPATDDKGQVSVHGLLKKHNGKTYWMTVNSARKAVKASFKITGVKGGRVLKENRAVSLSNGILTDDFAPYAVHIYELQ